ncbi:MAG: type II secretion system F family protein [Candidatus Geothermarchaeales archaeon]
MKLSDRITSFVFTFFARACPIYLKFFPGLSEDIKKSNLKIHPLGYASIVLFATTVGFVGTALGIFLLVLDTSYLLISILLLPIPLYILGVSYLIPKISASGRHDSIDIELPYAAAYISIMATGGVSPYKSISRLSKLKELFPAISKEAGEIVKHVTILAKDPLTAIAEVAQTNPFAEFKDFFLGYVTTVYSGGDVVHFLRMKTDSILRSRIDKIRVMSERLGVFLEIYVMVSIIMSLTLYILFSVQSFFAAAVFGPSVVESVILYSFVISPFISFIFMLIAHASVSKVPISPKKHYKVLMLSIIPALIFWVIHIYFYFSWNVGGIVPPSFIAAIGLGQPYRWPEVLTVGFSLLLAPSALAYRSVAKKTEELERGLTNFLIDLVEIKKTGLSPESCILNLAGREYTRSFNKLLRNIASQISWGVSLKRIQEEIERETENWRTRMIGFLLVETIDVGGGVPATLEALSQFGTTTQEIEEQRKMQTRPYTVIPYIAAVLLIGSTLLTLSLMGRTLMIGGGMGGGEVFGVTGQITEYQMEQTRLLFAVSLIMQCFLIGLVTGKISSGVTAVGFKHAAALVVLGYVSYVIFPYVAVFISM